MSERRLDIWIPNCLPDALLSPNRGERRGGRIPEEIMKAKEMLQAQVYWPIWNDHRAEEPFGLCHLILTLRWHERVKRKAAVKGQRVRPVTHAGEAVYRPDDPSNATYALKAAIDGIVLAGLLVDDSYRHIGICSTIVERCGPGEEGLAITLIEMARGPQSPPEPSF